MRILRRLIAVGAAPALARRLRPGRRRIVVPPAMPMRIWLDPGREDNLALIELLAFVNGEIVRCFFVPAAFLK